MWSRMESWTVQFHWESRCAVATIYKVVRVAWPWVSTGVRPTVTARRNVAQTHQRLMSALLRRDATAAGAWFQVGGSGPRPQLWPLKFSQDTVGFQFANGPFGFSFQAHTCSV